MKRIKQLFLLLLPLSLISCSSLRVAEKTDQWLYKVDDSNQQLLEMYAPVFVVSEPEHLYNRIGTPTVSCEIEAEGVFVDPKQSSLYSQVQPWTSGSRKYRNLIYRIHFPEVPYSLIPFHIGAGKNSGLLFIVTINEDNTPVLLTTVHTCGCYMAIIPFSSLPAESYPQAWDTESQWIYGVTLPGQLKDLQTALGEKIIIEIQPATHRVKNVTIGPVSEDSFDQHQIMDVLPMDTLWQLSSARGAVSFFETDGRRKGYVKGSLKPFERLFISWWAFDWHVGEDKAYGPAEQTGTPFYTSLKFWNRDDSDMWNFEQFLQFWGWDL